MRTYRGWEIIFAAALAHSILACAEWQSVRAADSTASDAAAKTSSTTPGTESPSARTLANERDELDRTVWSLEVEAQRFERAIVSFWDRLRKSDDKFSVLAGFPRTSITLGEPLDTASLELGIRRIRFGAPAKQLTGTQWRDLLVSFENAGFRPVESEWHHSSFLPNDEGAESLIDFVLHVSHHRAGESRSDDPRLILRGKLRVSWMPNGNEPLASDVSVEELEILTRAGAPMFEKAFTYTRRDHDVASAHPILLYDLDRNGYPEIVLSRWNRIYWNEGAGQFREGVFLKNPPRLAEAGLIADFTGDGRADFLSVDKAGRLLIFPGREGGSFEEARPAITDVLVPDALAMTAGDADRDGDLDLWVTQYKPAYLQGQMPTPYYDANDGEPAYYLENDGTGNFRDKTEAAGLAKKRHRRTYSASFVDLDEDRDLDLLVVSDYAGVDVYQNNGQGQFTDVTSALVDERYLFGMAHTFGDYNLDGRLDVYAIGMSSTTARRLDAMRLGREDRPDVHHMRSAMGFGNRMYLRDEDRWRAPAFASQVARTGWSWGTASCDFDLDGDQDIYVGNGFRSGESCQDYCSTFWRHDIYSGSSTPDPQVASLFSDVMRDLNAGQISWNGYEHNALLLNLDGQEFVNVAFLLGVGFEYDSRAVVANDLDGDGLPDLLVTEYQFAGRGWLMKLHVYRNTLHTANHWIGVRLHESAGSGGLLGAMARITSGDTEQVRHLVAGDSFLSQHANTLHFGLGDRTAVEKLEILWPNGQATLLDNPAIDRYHDVSWR